MSDLAPPNILLIMDDQHRGDCLSIDPHAMDCVQTPNLDYLAASGVHFTRAYTTCPSCIPARRTLLSGQTPATHGMVGMVDKQEWNPPATLPGELTKHGYQTAFIGRTMHQHPRWKRFGFEEMKLSLTIDRGRSAASEYELLLQKETEEEPGNPPGFCSHGIDWNGSLALPWPLRESLHEVHWTVNQAIHWLERRDPSRPFFLMVSFFGPHPPLVPPQAYYRRYMDMSLPEPSYGDWASPPGQTRGASAQAHNIHLSGQKLQQCKAGYFGLINYIDDQIRRFYGGHMGPAFGLSENNTITMFTSDHGEMLGDHYMFRKQRPYEGSARIPMLAAGPGIQSDITCDSPVCLEDVMPTILDLAKCPIPQSVEGESLAPILRGQRTTTRRNIVHGEEAHHPNGASGCHYLTNGKEKYIWFSQSGTEQLFDLEADPNECHDLSPENESRLAPWRQRLIEQLSSRPEGFSDGKKLISGKPHESLVPARV